MMLWRHSFVGHCLRKDKIVKDLEDQTWTSRDWVEEFSSHMIWIKLRVEWGCLYFIRMKVGN